jgi:type II secretory pathway pseudopilin PulG
MRVVSIQSNAVVGSQLPVISTQIARGERSSLLTTDYRLLTTKPRLPTTPRRGISLIEVLFAVGVLSVGILGMAALVPLGAYELVEAQKLDQSSTAGRAAFRDLEVRSYLQPKMWVDTQMGMLIDPDPTNGVAMAGTDNLPYGLRILSYPYLPANCWNLYFNSLQTISTSATWPPPGLAIPNTPTTSGTFAQPQLFPQSYPGPSASVGAPLAVSILPMILSLQTPSNPSPAPLVNLPYATPSIWSPAAPFTATESPVFVFDPLMIAETADTTLPLGDATIPNPSLPPPAQWKAIQMFPYQHTYQTGAPLLPRITMLPEWPKWPINGKQWPGGAPLSPIPSWPVPAIQNDGVTPVNWPPNGTATALPPVPAQNFKPWPNYWFQSTTRNPTIQYYPRIMPFVAADRIFRSTDDLVFNPQNLANPASDRPTQAFAYDQASTPNRLEPLYQGNYSWFATISPASAQSDSTSQDMQDIVTNPDPAALLNTRQFNVSVVICNNRVLTLPSLSPTTAAPSDTIPGEWQVPARVEPGSLGGGEVTLFANTPAQASWMTTIKPGQWLMLSGITVAGEIRNDVAGGNIVYWPRMRTIANWYRIVATDSITDPQNPPPFRSITVSGPDWPQGNQWDDTPVTGNPPPVLFGANPPPQGVQFAALNTLTTPSTYTYPNQPINIYAYATIVEGVVGVYQKTITVDGDSPFSAPD